MVAGVIHELRGDLPKARELYEAKDISVPPRRINETAHGKRAVTADAALRLARSPGHLSNWLARLRRVTGRTDADSGQPLAV